MTPCAARDGALAVSSGSQLVCVGCSHAPAFLMQDLAKQYPPARGQSAGDPGHVADKLRDLVRQATEPPAEQQPAEGVTQ